MRRAAGIMFVSAKGTALFLKRGPTAKDYPGAWDFPGGMAEGDETPEKAAIREAKEEIGFLPDGARTPHTMQRTAAVAPPVAAVGGPGAADATLGDAAPGTVESSLAAPVPQPDPLEFTTFLQRVPAEFEPKLDDEHVGWAWCPVDAPPQPLHPGTDVALARLGWDELGVAKAIRDGLLASPQRYENVSLFAMRITGTGAAFRHKHNEFVYRKPENYLTSEFLERCSGLPVIVEHPPKSTLDSKEFAKRVVGTIMLAYIKGDEVWGVAKIYDDAAALMMESELLSTSPAVVFRDPSVNSKLEMEDGSKLLIEGKPSLLDHLALCEQGVWDKGGEPAGVDAGLQRGDSAMAEETRKADPKADDDAVKKADAENGQKLDKILSAMDSLSTRMDSVEKRMDGDAEMADAKRKADAESKEKEDKERDDKARKDAEENGKEEEAERVAADKRKDSDKEKADAAKRKDDEDEKKKEEAKADSVTDPVARKRIDELSRMIPKALSDADYTAMLNAQAKADGVFMAFGDHAPRPLQGEDLTTYRRRLAGLLKQHSKSWGSVDLVKIADDNAFGIAETQIYADAMEAARNPADLPHDQLRSIVRPDGTGRNITEFAGKPSAWMSQFGGQRRRLSGIRTQSI